MFPISLLKKNCDHIEIDKHLKENLAVFHDVKKRFIFLITHLFLIFVNKENFFQEYIEMELKLFSIIVEGFFEWQK